MSASELRSAPIVPERKRRESPKLTPVEGRRQAKLADRGVSMRGQRGVMRCDLLRGHPASENIDGRGVEVRDAAARRTVIPIPTSTSENRRRWQEHGRGAASYGAHDREIQRAETSSRTPVRTTFDISMAP